MLSCYQAAKLEVQSNQKDPLLAQFASAKGSLRSASLLVMSQFGAFLESRLVRDWPTTEAAVEIKVNEFITAGQRQNPNFLRSTTQKKELVTACLKWLEVNKPTSAPEEDVKSAVRLAATAAEPRPINSAAPHPSHLVIGNSSFTDLVQVDPVSGAITSKTVNLKTRQSSSLVMPVQLLDVNVEKALQLQIQGLQQRLKPLSVGAKVDLAMCIVQGVYYGDCLGSASEGKSPTIYLPKFDYSSLSQTPFPTRFDEIDRQRNAKQPTDLARKYGYAQFLGHQPLTRSRPYFSTTDDTEQFVLGLDQMLESPDLHVNGGDLSERFIRPFLIQDKDGKKLESRINGFAESIKK
ncbi:MAG: hypothetical protein R3194_14380, partial [Limnobacter sp.]|nr:hypothetical protein [Limnobacter sp.]